MKDNIFAQLHETFTDDSNTVIKIEDLLNDIKHLPIEEQNMLLMQMLAASENQNTEYIKEKKEHEEFLRKRKTTKVEKRKVVSVTKLKPTQKEHINDAIKSHEKEISLLINLSFNEFKAHIENDEFIEDNINFYMLGIIKEITSYQKMADEAFLNKDNETINEIKECVQELQDKLNYLKQWSAPKRIDEANKARIIFFETSSNRSYFMQDIEDNTEYYDSFCELFQSIENENIKDLKKMDSNSGFKGVTEARDVLGKTRIFFDYIGNHTYVIYNAIIKKDDNSLSYRNQALTRYKMYQIQKEYIIEHMNDADFIERQNNYLKEIKELFGLEANVKKTLKPNQGDIK